VWPLGVDMDPLVVAGRVREQVHALLVDLEPLAVAEVLAERLAQLAVLETFAPSCAPFTAVRPRPASAGTAGSVAPVPSTGRVRCSRTLWWRGGRVDNVSAMPDGPMPDIDPYLSVVRHPVVADRLCRCAKRRPTAPPSGAW